MGKKGRASKGSKKAVHKATGQDGQSKDFVSIPDLKVSGASGVHLRSGTADI